MIEDSPIVKETRKVRCSISERFGNDPDRYIDYLLSREDKDRPELRPNAEVRKNDQSIETTGQC
jgi:hypothetical protein